jgi:hypothetical protein
MNKDYCTWCGKECEDYMYLPYCSRECAEEHDYDMKANHPEDYEIDNNL